MSDYVLGPTEIAIVPYDEGIFDIDLVRLALTEATDGSYYFALKQSDNEIALDFEEIPLLAEAARLLQETAERHLAFKADEAEANAAKADEAEAEEWPAPSENFLGSLGFPEIANLLLSDSNDYDSLSNLFTWGDSPQGYGYWSDIHNGRKPFDDKAKNILRGWLKRIL